MSFERRPSQLVARRGLDSFGPTSESARDECEGERD